MTILDSQGHEVKIMPEWHRDINKQALFVWCGHFFTFEGIDPDHDPDVVIIKYKEPTGKTKKRRGSK